MAEKGAAGVIVVQDLPAVAHETEYVTAADGVRLFVQRWRPARGTVQAVMVLSHGLGEHAGTYGPFVGHFVPRGVAIYGHDHRGFGRSGGRRGYVARYAQFVTDLRPLVERARAENPGVPLVLVGHSMGGTIGLLVAMRYPALIDYAVYSAPALMVGISLPVWLHLLGHAMSYVYPMYTQHGAIRPDLLTRDPVLQAETEADPIRHTRVTARLYTEMFGRAPREVFAHLRDLRVPFLVLHGTEDPLVPPAASRRVYAGAAAADKTLKLYPGLRHEPFREVEREEVFADVAAWMAARGMALSQDGR